MKVHLLLSAGRGPQECEWALAELLRRLTAEAATRGLRTEISSGTTRSALVTIEGDDPGRFADGWTGTLCWQASSPLRTGIGRKNWYVIAERVSLDIAHTVFSENDVEVVPTRTGGPGGQHRDKASTAARATHRPSGLVVVVDTERQFGLNRRIALRRLRERLEAGDTAAERAAITERWRVHDHLVRGNPARIERPVSAVNDPRRRKPPRPARRR
ncbi:peptide chain release factor-like protein [Actinoplanes sp. M2I2]|uniref:peptide chain release factor-like protein n=1 Tax=Actinoplanes sp. M2I2 TaxID=1734444 RepID=UPI0020228152|nr:peptide chain release factor-like protein [Actinoplanes sp. M2I2]